MKRTTVIIVGAGPAGSACALSLARKGIESIVLERGQNAGEKNVASFVLFTDVLKHLIPDFMDDAPLERAISEENILILGKERPSAGGILYHGVIKDFLPAPLRWVVSPFVRKGRDVDPTVDYGSGSDKGLEDRMDSVIIQKDKNPHITVNSSACPECSKRQCIISCPAGNYEWNEQDCSVILNHEGCLECGTCRYICDSIQWSYPSHGNGVRFRWG